MLQTTDAQIKEDLLRALSHERLGEIDIEISVDRYIVTLKGTVECVTDQLLIQEAAWRIEGVMDVVNNLKVKSPASSRTDAEIAEAVRQALEWDSLLRETNIRFTVTNGWVALEGTVNLSRERAGAERMVLRLTGVRGVYNNIVVNPSEIKAENICDTIGEELKRRAEQEAGRIQVLLKDGSVTLSGSVHSWEERCAIINAASRVPGVEVVKDSLAIKPRF
ncbi:MAG TPA: BON domain-containing protein [Pyrinomonadaceae bacterium]|nr:BON domain-containing protein [Pyrinomonadaceae bacterium]